MPVQVLTDRRKKKGEGRWRAEGGGPEEGRVEGWGNGSGGLDKVSELLPFSGRFLTTDCGNDFTEANEGNGEKEDEGVG